MLDVLIHHMYFKIKCEGTERERAKISVFWNLNKL